LSSRGLPLVLLLNYAHGFALVLLALSFRLLIATTLLQKRQERRRQTAQFLRK
jgi:molybdate transport system permease protein